MDAQLNRDVIIAAFDDRLAARQAVSELEAVGFGHNDIGFVIRGDDAVQGGMITDASGTKDGTGAIRGAATGGVVGGLLGATVAILIPGVGPVLAAGIIGATLGGAAAGAATGGLIGAMAGLDLSEHEASFFEREFHEGKAIVTVHPRGQADLVIKTLKQFGGYDITTAATDPLNAAEGTASQAHKTLI
jgi:hypothetical protein